MFPEIRTDTGRRKRILFVLEYFPPHIGGVETLFANLTTALASQGHQVSVITLWLPGTPTEEKIGDVEVVRVKTPQIARRYLFMLLALPTVLRRARHADLIHTTTYNAAILAWFGAMLWKRPIVLTVHEVFGEQWNNLLGLNPVAGYAFRAFEWLLLHLPFTHYLCDSGFTQERLVRLAGVSAARTSVVYPAVDYRFWDPVRHERRTLHDDLRLQQGTFVYLYFGRPGISKGVEYLIDAAARVRAQLPSSHLLLLLAKDPLDQYRRIMRRIRRLGLSDYVTVLDPVPRADLPGFLLAADCVVIPSISEGFGYAAIEAATLGCTVIATSGHSVQEILPDSVTFVPRRDAGALAAAVLDAARAKPQRRCPRKFEIESHIDGVTAIYDMLATPSPAPDAAADDGGRRERRGFNRRRDDDRGRLRRAG